MKVKGITVFNNYFKLIVISIGVQIIFRFFETFLIIVNFGMQQSLFISEIKGLFYDLLLTLSLLTIAIPVYYFICRFSLKFAWRFFLALIVVFTVLHFFILKFFVYQLNPLDTFVFQYSLKEIIFTVSTSDTNFPREILELAILLLFIYLLIRFISKTEPSSVIIKIVYWISLLSLPVFVFLQYYGVEPNKYALNKSFYFYSNTISRMVKNDSGTETYTRQDAIKFQALYPEKSFVSTKYPMLHHFRDDQEFGRFFKECDKAPNIVILIVEGLNDDFVHPFRGVSLMPFLQKLKDSSLYWNRCFTLGERSFAVVPSLLGSLPYGKIGFTLLDKLPVHISLVAILHANGYYTSFFDGQGSWFHKKDRFFKLNNIDLIFDNKKFSKSYKKIIVGDDHFFWGYNDKDLFRASFQVLDTLTTEKRLDIYYTGTSHSPFVIDDVPFYDKRFSELLGELNNEPDIRFFKTYKKFIQSVLFVDDALKEYFENAKKLPGYDNTIFFITGDHPMTEIPIGNSLKRYHVPLIIYSPKLSKPQTFSHTVSHLDVSESLLSLLAEYQIQAPEISTALGDQLFPDQPKGNKIIAFMNDNREIIDFYSNGYYLSGKQLYKVGEDLSITPVRDRGKLIILQNELDVFKKTNNYVSLSDKIMSDSLYCKDLGYSLVVSGHNDTGMVRVHEEFYNLIESVEIKRWPFYYDISFDYTGNIDKNLSLVYQLTTQKDSLIYWRSNRISPDQKSFQVHNHIPLQSVSDSILYLNSYFRNKGKQNFEFGKLRILVYSK